MKYFLLYGHALAQEPAPGVMKFTISRRLFPRHHYITLSLSDLCLDVKKKILKEIMHFHYIYDLYGHALEHEPLPHEIFLVDSPLVIITL